MSITEKRATGDRGEEIACEFLVKRGLEIVERNYWRKWGEIDIVARNLKDRSLHFVEVKSVVKDLSQEIDVDDDGGYSPADNMTRDKKRRLARVIQTYILENRLGESDWQVDLVLVYLDRDSIGFRIEMLEDVEL